MYAPKRPPHTVFMHVRLGSPLLSTFRPDRRGAYFTQPEMSAPSIFASSFIMLPIAVITGGGGGLGRAIALTLSKTYHVALLDLVQSRLEEVQEMVGKERCSIWTCDICQPSEVDRVASEILALGTVKLLVNNAGQAVIDSLHDSTPTNFAKEVELNLTAAFTMYHAFEPHFRANPQGVNIINIASVNGLMSNVGNPAYSAAKAGLISLTKSMAVELGSLGIRANAVAPGTVITTAWTTRLKERPDALDDIKKWYPLKRPIVPEDIANAVAFLASDLAAAITGVCLPVDAGLTAGPTAIAHAITHSDIFAS